MGTTASALGAHAEGDYTTASGYYSHAEGGGTTASGTQSHAEGSGTVASGNMSHAEGYYTIANHAYQHVFGQYNIQDPSTTIFRERGTYVEVVGNGERENSRSNARTLDWSGNEVLSGKLTVGTQPTNDNDVATKKYVDDHSGGGALICTLNPNVSPRVLDKTYGEIYNALLSRRSVFLNNNGYIYTTAYCNYEPNETKPYCLHFAQLAWNFLPGGANDYPTEDLG